MIPESDEFYHPSVVKSVYQEGFDLKIAGKSFKASGVTERAHEDRREFHCHVHLHDHWVKGALSFKRQDPVADCWFWLGYGTTAVSAPMIERKMVWVRLADDEMVIALDASLGTVLHGQGTCPAHFGYDFQNGVTVVTKSVNYKPTPLVPHDPNGTGEQPWMGRWHEFASIEEARELLYPIGCYGGIFVHGDKEWLDAMDLDESRMNTFVTEDDYPELQLFPGSHFPSVYRYPADHWINYSDPRAPWKNKATMRTANREHYTIYRPAALALQQFPWDIGLRWLCIATANRYLFELPAEPKRDQWLFPPASPRGMGRPMLVATALVRGLKLAGEVDIAFKVGKRALDRFLAQKQDWVRDIAAGRTWIPEFHPRGTNLPKPAYSPRQLGIWWHGLDELDDVLEEYDQQIPELDYMKDEIAAQVFAWFDIDGNDVPQLPYYAHLDGSHPPQHEAGAEHFAIAAALDHTPQTAAEEWKWERLEEFAKTTDPKWLDR